METKYLLKNEITIKKMKKKNKKGKHTYIQTLAMGR